MAKDLQRQQAQLENLSGEAAFEKASEIAQQLTESGDAAGAAMTYAKGVVKFILPKWNDPVGWLTLPFRLPNIVTYLGHQFKPLGMIFDLVGLSRLSEWWLGSLSDKIANGVNGLVQHAANTLEAQGNDQAANLREFKTDPAMVRNLVDVFGLTANIEWFAKGLHNVADKQISVWLPNDNNGQPNPMKADILKVLDGALGHTNLLKFGAVGLSFLNIFEDSIRKNLPQSEVLYTGVGRRILDIAPAGKKEELVRVGKHGVSAQEASEILRRNFINENGTVKSPKEFLRSLTKFQPADILRISKVAEAIGKNDNLIQAADGNYLEADVATLDLAVHLVTLTNELMKEVDGDRRDQKRFEVIVGRHIKAIMAKLDQYSGYSNEIYEVGAKFVESCVYDEGIKQVLLEEIQRRMGSPRRDSNSQEEEERHEPTHKDPWEVMKDAEPEQFLRALRSTGDVSLMTLDEAEQIASNAGSKAVAGLMLKLESIASNGNGNFAKQQVSAIRNSLRHGGDKVITNEVLGQIIDMMGDSIDKNVRRVATGNGSVAEKVDRLGALLDGKQPRAIGNLATMEPASKFKN